MAIQKILVMGNNDHRGGLIVHYEYLVKFLERKDYEIICININDNYKKNFEDNRITEIRIPYNPKTLGDKTNKLFNIIYCCLKVKKFKPDLFIAAGLGDSYTTIASFLGKDTFKIHQEVIFDAKLDRYRIKINKRFDAIAVQTKSMIKNYKDNVNNNAVINYLPCFTRKMLPAKIMQPTKSKTIIRLVYFGRLAHNKGLVNFINNTKDVFTNENIVLDIYGKGKESKNINNVITRNTLENKISLKGSYSDEDFPNLIVSYDAVILPSTYNEGLPLVLIESMHYNRPIFASKMGAIPELAIINDGIFLSDFDKSQSSNLIEFIKLLKRGEFNGTKIKDVYDLNFSNERFEKIWTTMLRNPNQYFS